MLRNLSWLGVRLLISYIYKIFTERDSSVVRNMFLTIISDLSEKQTTCLLGNTKNPSRVESFCSKIKFPFYACWHIKLRVFVKIMEAFINIHVICEGVLY